MRGILRAIGCLAAMLPFVGCACETTAEPDGPPVEIISIHPAEGPTSGGTPVSITGRGFVEVREVTLGGAPLVDLVVVGESLITRPDAARRTGTG